ncbi:MAG TPA: DUF4394 domain-containing protein [Pirellula sp.]|nr:DUF4394 domain-containing protein [Pirellula sp.]
MFAKGILFDSRRTFCFQQEASTMTFRSLFTIGLTALMVGGFCQSAPAVIISALTSTNALVTFDSATPGTILSNIAVSGLTAGDSLVGIDYRPADGQFVGLGYNSGTGAARVYALNGGVATSINTLALGPGLNRITADFNPTANALRVVTSAATNFRAPTGGTGALTPDANINGGNNTGILATAYSRNNAGGGTSGATTLYAIDGTNLVTQGSIDFFTGSGTSPNTGTLSTVAALSGVTGSSIVGFDIFNAPGTAAGSPGTAFIATNNALFSLNLVTGAASSLGTVGGGFTIVDIAAVPEPSSLAFASLAIAGVIAGYRRRRRNSTSSIR